MGLISVYKMTNDDKYLESVCRAADFAVETIDISRWSEMCPFDPTLNVNNFLVSIVEGLAAVYSITKNDKYLDAAEKIARLLPDISPDAGRMHSHGYLGCCIPLLEIRKSGATMTC